jgi:hypothetical protein
LTGHNHRDWCTCGWCAGGWRNSGGSDTVSYASILAKATLADFGVKSATACYVNPNATCPVCGEQVYFYSNDHGSRVYFDELGPPWTKHGCTIQERQISSTTDAQSSGPAVRPQAERKTLVDAAECVGMLKGRSLWNDSRNWELFVVTEVSTSGSTIVHGESLSGDFGKKTSFEFNASASIILVGDLFSRLSERISFIRRDNFDPVEIKNGDKLPSLNELAIEAQKVADAAAKREREIKEADEKKKRKQTARENERKRIAALLVDPKNRAKIDASQRDAQLRVQARVEIVVVKRKIKKSSSTAQTSHPVDNIADSKQAKDLMLGPSKYEMTDSEIRHFQSGKWGVADLCRQFEPIVKGYARSGIRKPRDVASQLNSDGHRTVDEQPWTAHLVFILLGLIFSGPPSGGSKEKQPSPTSAIKSENRGRTSTKDEQITQDDLEVRLSALGRVTKRLN